MIIEPFRRWTHPVSRFLGCLALLSFGGLTARAQESTAPQSPAASTRNAKPQPSDQLQQQLQQLKQQYDATTRDLEQRIASLEQQIEKEKQREEEKQARNSVGGRVGGPRGG